MLQSHLSARSHLADATLYPVPLYPGEVLNVSVSVTYVKLVKSVKKTKTRKKKNH